MSFFGVSSKNHAQKVAMQALVNDKPFTFITGPAGGGKSLVAQAVGLEHTIETHRYRKLVYTRLQIQLGMNIGAFPGNPDEKTQPFMRPFLDNLEVMSDQAKQIVAYSMVGGDKSKILFEPIQTMQGGTQHQAFFISDESQNLDPFTMHGIATRIGDGSKFVFLGNFSQVAVGSLRKPQNNGFYQLLNGLYEEEAYDMFDHINLTEIQRNPAIEVVERILRNHQMPEEFEALEARGNVFNPAIASDGRDFA